MLFLATAALNATGVAEAATAQQVCSDLSTKATNVGWDLMEEAGAEAFCHKSWVQAIDRFNACDGLIYVKFGNKLKNVWNRFVSNADASWATWGPRGAGPVPETGTIVGGFKRTFFAAGINEGTSTVTVRKTGGQARAEITICRLARDGRVVTADRYDYASGTGGTTTPAVYAYTNDDNYLMGIVVDTPASFNTFSYSVQVTSQPTISETREVSGIADLHVHQYANLGYAGRFYWGDSLEPPATGLAREVINGDITNPFLTLNDFSNYVAQTIVNPTINSVDANLLFRVIRTGKPNVADGFVTVGTEGHPTFVDWPHHADTTHQQAHISWIEAAHTYGDHHTISAPRAQLDPQKAQLNLMVVSVVNNEPLCVVLKAIDRFGNAPLRDAQGNITGWRSAHWDCDDEDNVVRQLQALHAAEQQYPWYRIAMNPWHARRIINEGDLAVVISMETDKPLSGPAGNYGDWEYQLDLYRAMGMTTMQIVHQSNNPFAGAALHRNLIELVQLVQWPLQSVGNLFNNLLNGQQATFFNVDDQGFNERGLTDEGGELVDAMVARSMPIDLAHGSLRTRRAVMGRVPERYGLYDSHTKFERLLTQPSLDREQTFMVQEQILNEYVADQVLVGLRTSPVDLNTAPGAAPLDNDCPGSAKSYMQTVKYASDRGLCFAIGSDFNTGVSQLGPRFGPGACWAANGDLVADPTTRAAPQLLPNATQPALPAWSTGVPTIDGTRYYEDGLAMIAWLPELTRDLVGLMGSPGPADKLLDSAEAYIKMWERAYDHGDSALATGSAGLGAACTNSGACDSGLCRDGQCVCQVNGDCPTDQYCEADVDLSANRCRSKKPDGDPCPLINGGDKCISGFCGAGRCYTPNSKGIADPCWVGAECREGRCNNLTDGLLGTCVCTDDDECGTNQYCDAGLDFTVNQCRNKKADWSSCDIAGGGHQCLGNHCAYGRCFTPDSVTIGGACFVDRQCASDRCSSPPGTNGTCVCDNDSHCGTNQWCDGGLDFSLNQCRAKRRDFESCPAVGGGHACLSGHCRYGRCFTYNSVSLGGACFVDDQCTRGKCSSVAGTNGTCVCDRDSDCGSNAICIRGTLGIGRNYCAATRSPTCPAGWSYEIRNPLNRDRCRRTTTQYGTLRCRLAITDKAKNWTGPHAQRGADECRSVKNKPPKGVKCPSGYTHNIRSGADTCTQSVTSYRTPSCPSGWDYHSQSGRDLCRDL